MSQMLCLYAVLLLTVTACSLVGDYQRSMKVYAFFFRIESRNVFLRHFMAICIVTECRKSKSDSLSCDGHGVSSGNELNSLFRVCVGGEGRGNVK